MSRDLNDDPVPPCGVDISRPTVARMYDYYLGGSHNYASDRAAVDAVTQALPEIHDMAVEARAFLRRVVRHMCRQGVCQFIDIGSGLPSADNTHQVARRMVPDARIVYCDIDETAVAEGRQMLRGDKSVTFVQGSALDLETILGHPDTKALIDFSQPVGVLMMGLVHFFSVEKGSEIIGQLQGRLTKGSYLGLTHGTTDGFTPGAVERTHAAYARTPTPLFLRPKGEVEVIVSGHKLVEPGLVKVHEWRMEEAETGEPEPSQTLIWYGAVLSF